MTTPPNDPQSAEAPADLQSMFEAIEQALADDQWAAAQAAAAALLARVPEHPQVLALRGLAEMQEGRFTAARKTLERTLNLDANLEPARINLDELAKREAQVLEQDYVKEYLANRAVFMDLPRALGIETVGRCNATCGFCPHSELERNRLEMPEELFEKILRDLAEFPRDWPLRVYPNMVNEPFMDKRIFERLAGIQDVLPNAVITAFTNFNVLPKGWKKKIAGVRNLNVNVSFNAAEAEEYKAVMGIDFERTVKNLRDLMALNRETGLLKQPIVLSRVMDGSERDAKYRHDCKRAFEGFEEDRDYMVHVKPRTNWLGATEDDPSPVPYFYPCGAWYDMNIMCTGQVPLCCIDSKGDWAVGDVNEQSILEIYNGPKFRGLRATVDRREDADPCDKCSLVQ